jgi:hypothetical protein
MPVTEAPYYSDGSLANHPDEWGRSKGRPDMQPITPFGAQLVLTDYTKGRSAVNFIFREGGGSRIYPMFLTDFFKLAKSGDLNHGVISYRIWTVTKRGANYGIIPLALVEGKK